MNPAEPLIDESPSALSDDGAGSVAADQRADEIDPQPQPGSPATSDEDRRLLGVLADIRVVVQAELGRATMPLSAVLDMLPGTVFELGRSVSEPIDLLVDGSVVGHGEVVAVDEHFGIRVVGVGAHSAPSRPPSGTDQ